MPPLTARCTLDLNVGETACQEQNGVGAQARKKNRHFGRQAAPADVNVVSQLMNKNQNDKTNSEFGTKQSPINRDERSDAQNEFQFEDGGEQELAFG